MEELRIKGIVVNSSDFKDSDKIVTIFSAELGIIKARARGVKKPKAKLAFAAQPFAFCEFMLISKGGFYSIINASSIDQFFDITADFDKYIFCLAALEVCQKTIKENDDCTEIFLLLLNLLKVVCYGKCAPMSAYIKFILEALKFLGFAVAVDACACCDNELPMKLFAFSYDFNGMLCAKCSNRNEYLELTAGEYAILKNINMTNLDNLGNLKFLSRNDLVSVISLLCKIFRLSTDEEIETINKFL